MAASLFRIFLLSLYRASRTLASLHPSRKDGIVMNAQLKPVGLHAVAAVAKHVYAVTTPRAILPFLDAEVAIPSRRYIGKYYWQNRCGRWLKVVDVDVNDGRWQLARTDRQGHVFEKPSWHTDKMSAMNFADRPFVITRG
jgi:hypothetical protein